MVYVSILKVFRDVGKVLCHKLALIQNQEQLQMQSEVFDQMMDERSENMREVDTLRNVDMAQRKMDDSITKKFIQSITE